MNTMMRTRRTSISGVTLISGRWGPRAAIENAINLAPLGHACLRGLDTRAMRWVPSTPLPRITHVCSLTRDFPVAFNPPLNRSFHERTFTNIGVFCQRENGALILRRWLGRNFLLVVLC